MKMVQFRVMRERKGLTQSDVAKLLECKDKSTVSKWETGAALPNAKLLTRIAELYGCTVDELLRELVE